MLIRSYKIVEYPNNHVITNTFAHSQAVRFNRIRLLFKKKSPALYPCFEHNGILLDSYSSHLLAPAVFLELLVV